ncbi:LamG-like jellyroll fold domain-containing protein [Pedosphaera parvula]|uniref:Immunoglobulin I-set domain protein n=1 Tax=Pedosphaera parvula (strain Ellin514) TaxID=320771 RepID=B9XA44_PEDPL|nr:LamG-like jellyroll fold domain-containing protein [Pedosphaera parvula]EEF63385.1 Immunoglobulin I-set domain protein [Pedosphaera parvula Ellin514]
MKRNLLARNLKQSFLAIPAAALMLGAAQAGTTVGLNIQAWTYADGGAGYQTTGFPVTAKAFGVDAGAWVNTEPLYAYAAVSTNIVTGSLTVNLTAPNSWQSGIGALNAGFVPEVVTPGNDEVTWGYLDDGNATGQAPSASVAGLAATFPNGYVIQTIAANGGVQTFTDVVFTDGVTTNTAAYSTYQAGLGTYGTGTVGLSAPSGVFTGDSININPQPKTSSTRSTLAAFIITDKPVVTKAPVGLTVNQGTGFTLSAGVIGIAPITYQWQHAGTNISGATSLNYTNLSAAPSDAGNYTLVATNPYGSGTSGTATVGVIQVPVITTDFAGITNTVYTGFKTVMSVVAGGASPLSYQWKKNGTAITGATNASLTVSNLTTGLAGYSVVITNTFGSVKSSTNYLNVVAAPDAYTMQVGSDGPASFWPLNETTTPTAYDYAGFGHNGTQTNGLTLGVASLRPPTYPGFSAGNTVYQFDGSSGYINCGTAPSLSGPTDFTVEAWVNTTSPTSQAIVHQRDSANYVGAYRVGINADGTVYFILYGTGGFQFSFNSTLKVNDGNWHHVATVRSGANGLIYVDGVQAGTASGAVQDLTGTLNTFIGRNQRDNNEWFAGMMADVAIYESALSSLQIVKHYTAASGVTLQVHLTTGGMIQDTKPSGTPHHGQNSGATWLTSLTDAAGTPVTRNGVEQFSAASLTKITVPADPDFDSPSGTISFWMKANAPLPGAGNEAATLFDRRTTNGTFIALNVDGSIYWQGQGTSRNTFSGGYLPDDNWHHVAVTYGQTTNDTLSIYVDGVLANSVPVTNAWSWPTTQPIEIGVSHDSYWKKFDGQMDDFRIYNRVLNGTEISQIFASDALVDTSALKLRYNFDDGTGVGKTVTWTFGRLESSPTLGPSAVWTPAASTPPFMFAPTDSAKFFRAVLP